MIMHLEFKKISAFIYLLIVHLFYLGQLYCCRSVDLLEY